MNVRTRALYSLCLRNCVSGQRLLCLLVSAKATSSAHGYLMGTIDAGQTTRDFTCFERDLAANGQLLLLPNKTRLPQKFVQSKQWFDRMRNA